MPASDSTRSTATLTKKLRASDSNSPQQLPLWELALRRWRFMLRSKPSSTPLQPQRLEWPLILLQQSPSKLHTSAAIQAAPPAAVGIRRCRRSAKVDLAAAALWPTACQPVCPSAHNRSATGQAKSRHPLQEILKKRSCHPLQEILKKEATAQEDRPAVKRQTSKAEAKGRTPPRQRQQRAPTHRNPRPLAHLKQGLLGGHRRQCLRR